MSDKMSCGHEYRYISRSDERTNFCVWCEWQATVAELAQLRAANAELQAEIKELRERSAAENSEITNCLKNIAELVTQRRGMEIELSDVRAALAQAQQYRGKWLAAVNERNEARGQAAQAQAERDDARDTLVILGDRLLRRAEQAEAREKQARLFLQKCGGYYYDADLDASFCVSCDYLLGKGHSDGCELSAALAGPEGGLP